MSGQQHRSTKTAKNSKQAGQRTRTARRRSCQSHEEQWAGMIDLRSAPLPTAQRQQLVANIGHSQGNTHLLRMITPIQRDDREKPPTQPITTPVDETATINKRGAAELKVGEIAVVVLPDGHSQAKKMRGKAHTSFKLKWGKFQYESTRGAVTAVTEPVPPPITVTIQTIYGPRAAATDPSAYGRGTTEEDKQVGNTSLGFHEGRHGLDYLAYLKKEPLPAFAGAVGMSVKEFKQAIRAYRAAVAAYTKKMNEQSAAATDCVGEKADFCVEQPQP